MRPGKMPRQLAWLICGCVFFVQTVDGKRDGKGTSDLWLKAWGMFDVGCPYLKDAKVESEAVNFLILILQPKM